MPKWSDQQRKRVGTALRDARRRAGFRYIKQFAEVARLSTKTIGLAEAGDVVSDVTLDTLERALGWTEGTLSKIADEAEGSGREAAMQPARLHRLPVRNLDELFLEWRGTSARLFALELDYSVRRQITAQEARQELLAAERSAAAFSRGEGPWAPPWQGDVKNSEDSSMEWHAFQYGDSFDTNAQRMGEAHTATPWADQADRLLEALLAEQQDVDHGQR